MIDASIPDSETFNGIAGKVTIKAKFNHEGEVHRARHCPKDPTLIATKSPNTDVFVFRNKDVPQSAAVAPTFRCKGHDAEGRNQLVHAVSRRGHICIPSMLVGWAVCWNPHTDAQLISGSDDSVICHWDLRKYK